ncbi:MBL fold metallo-hydrolase [Crocosphaera sp.]|uniref:MBL fold metallo-hydrolase n=1 Tax=Crocosphaera sp. TaxID=2729996 RepID=UPI002624BA24|nr:MBL fold metallo-hydrolase [Crocosphaera sp.]MDJ0582811.1 MBL fold metallo-hydrolase [Crocosphaera sp.]
MANLEKRRSENISGNFYVDSSCIDCDTCRWMSPAVFHKAGNQSAVYHQPTETREIVEAYEALLSCPTASIGTVEKPSNIKEIHQRFPLPIADNVYHCGYHSEKSFAAASYFIQREDGNILIDSPRFSPPLVKQLEAKGGIKYLYLTHKDDIADHEKFANHFGCERILHKDDITEKTQGVEIQLSGEQTISLTPDLLIIPVPGHSKGHTVLLYKKTYLFTGDHLAWSPYLNHLYAFHRFCWYDWEKQISSMKMLADYSFEWVLPGHGRRYHNDRETMKEQMTNCIQWMESQ